jgi:hypothetical protein
MKRARSSYPTSVRLNPQSRSVVMKIIAQTGWSESVTINRLVSPAMRS